MRRGLKLSLGLLALAATGVPAAAGWWAWQVLNRPFSDHPGERLVDVEPGTGAGEILEQLESAGVLPDARLARAYLVYKLGDPALQAGEYRFDRPLSTLEVLDRLIRGAVVTYPVTVIEGLTLEEIADVLAARGFGDAETLRLEMRRSDLVADLDPEATDLEGYLFPDTYSFASGTPESEIVGALVRNFRRRFTAEVEPIAADRGLTVRELVTLASIVEKEARLDSERALIAGVYSNRLEIGMALYADPTVIYGLRRLGRWDGNLRRADLKVDSPYNTYVYPGLPPGPICSPGLASLIAAADPAESKFLYFVSRNDGSHVFAETLSEHNRNVTRWQKQYWRERWARERQSK